MKTLKTILVACLVVSGVLFFSRQSIEGKTAITSSIDTTKPDTWEASVKRAEENISEIANALISVAKNEKRPNEDRIKAILLLGKIVNEESLDFLISNVSLRIPPARSRDILLDWPCMCALSRGDWRVAQAVLRSLKKPRNKRDLMRLAYVLTETLTSKRAIAIVDVELAKLRISENIYKKNLKVIKTHLNQER